MRRTGEGEVRTAEQLVAHAKALQARHGFRTHKLKGGVFPPDHELACYRALARRFPAKACASIRTARCRSAMPCVSGARSRT